MDVTNKDPYPVAVKRGVLLDEMWVERLETLGVDRVGIRSAVPANLGSVFAPNVTGGIWDEDTGQYRRSCGRYRGTIHRRTALS
ncbi:MAG: hypothetical protein R3E08_09180 [Thiotrichaceae bacterium]